MAALSDGNRSWMDTAVRPSSERHTSCIVIPDDGYTFVKVKASMIQLVQVEVQFGGLPSEDPNNHIVDFVNLCNTLSTYRGVANDVLRLKLFPFSLRDKAKNWFKSLQPSTIHTWDEMEHCFLTKYFPPKQMIMLRNEIFQFVQAEDESLQEAWERFKELLRRVPNHSIPLWMQVQTFYNGLMDSCKSEIEVVVTGELDNMTAEAMYELIEKLVAQSYKWHACRSETQPVLTASSPTDTTVSALVAQLDEITKQLAKLSQPQPQPQPQPMAAVSQAPLPLSCNFYGEAHSTVNCQVNEPVQKVVMELVDHVNHPRQEVNDPFAPTYNKGWRNHPAFSWTNNQDQPAQAQPEQQLPQEKHNQAQTSRPQQQFYSQPATVSSQLVPPYVPPHRRKEEKKSSMEEMFAKSMHNALSSIKNLENQMHELPNIVLPRNEELILGDMEEDSEDEIQPMPFQVENELSKVARLQRKEDSLEPQLPQTKLAVVQPQIEAVTSETVSSQEKFSETFKSAYVDMPYSVFPWSFFQESCEDNALEIQEKKAREVVVQDSHPVIEKGVEQIACEPYSGQTNLYFDPLHSLLKPPIDHIIVDENWVFKPP
ncbi:hypothetical protein M5689_022844 [Euphorbia peplus]|nr:hypothetical protein M5689_022844 [Euphorbia peplus]